jgi:hypothetical protein
MTTPRPYAFIDVDEVLQASAMKYGYERTAVIEEHIPTELVHPAMRPKKLRPGPDGLPAHYARNYTLPKKVRYRTPVRTSTKLRDDIAALDLDIYMLTSWLEHDSVDEFFAQSGGAPFPYKKLVFPGRDHSDPLGAVPASWKVDELIRTVDADPRPFIWLDDDEVPVWGATLEARYRDIPHLLIAPLDGIGMTPHHMELMREFVAAHGATDGPA